MRRYIKLIGLASFIICTVTIFYITLTLNVKKLPQFEIQTIAGEESAVEPVIVHGMFGANAYNRDKFKLEDDETAYFRYRSLLDQTDHFYIDQKVIDLQHNYRNFMRGKGSNPRSFYENKDYIAYGNVNYTQGRDYKFNIEILDKETKKVVLALTEAIPNRNDYSYFDIAHVHMTDNQLQLITINDFTNNKKLQEARLYTFDMNEEKLVNNDQIFEMKNSEKYSSHSYLTVLNKDNRDRKKIALYAERTDLILDEEEGSDAYSEKVAEKKVVIYDLADQSVEQLDLINDFSDVGIPFYADDESIYFGTTLINELEIEKYNIKEKALEEELAIELNLTDVDRDNINSAKIDDGILYYMPTHHSDYTKEPSLVIVDLKKMEGIYEGYLRLKDGHVNTDTSLDIERLDVK